MTIILTPAVLIAAFGLGMVFLVHVSVIARWTARVQTMLEAVSERQQGQATEIVSLRASRHDTTNKLTVHELKIDHLEERVDDLAEGRP